MIVPVSIKHLLHVAARDCGRYAINGIFIKRVADDRVEAVATNGRALVKVEYQERQDVKEKFVKKFNGKTEQLMIEGSIYEGRRLSKALDETKQGMASIQRGWLLLEETDHPETTMSHTHNLDAQSVAKVPGIFPKYAQVIPKDDEAKTKVILNIEQLEKVLKCMRGIGVKNVTFHIGEEGRAVRLTGTNTDIGGEKVTAALMPTVEEKY